MCIQFLCPYIYSYLCGQAGHCAAALMICIELNVDIGNWFTGSGREWRGIVQLPRLCDNHISCMCWCQGMRARDVAE